MFCFVFFSFSQRFGPNLSAKSSLTDPTWVKLVQRTVLHNSLTQLFI